MQKKILIVDDNKEHVELLKDILEYDGYAVECAFDGNEGLSKAKQFLPNLILLDINIPPKDGWYVCRELKADKNTNSIPVIICTGRDIAADIDEVAETLELGVVAYLIKPVNIDVMKEKLKNLLQ